MYFVTFTVFVQQHTKKPNKFCEWLQYIKKLHAKQKVKGHSTRSTDASKGRFIALAVD